MTSLFLLAVNQLHGRSLRLHHWLKQKRDTSGLVTFDNTVAGHLQTKSHYCIRNFQFLRGGINDRRTRCLWRQLDRSSTNQNTDDTNLSNEPKVKLSVLLLW